MRDTKKRIEGLVGTKFSRWTIVEYAGTLQYGKYKKHAVKVLCDCGTEKVIVFESLTSKEPSRSCGCYKSEVTAERNKANATHGLSKHESYSIWTNMKIRCSDKTNQAYKDYGGRGITVCERWLSSVENFIEDMGPRPSPSHSLERKDNDLGYSPSNCVWATKTEQANNRRGTKRYIFKGSSISLSNLSRLCGLPAGILRNRIENLGYSVDDAVTTPVRGMRKKAVVPDGAVIGVSDALDAIRSILLPYRLMTSVTEALIAASSAK